MAGKVLGAAVHHDVRSQRERVLQIGRKKRVIDNEHRPAGMGQLGCRADVGDVHHRVGRRFDVEGLGRVGDSLRGLLHPLAEIDRGKGNAPRLAHRAEQARRTAVQVRLGHHMVAGGKQLHHGQNCRHPGGKGHGVCAAFQRSNGLFQLLAGGVLHTAIIVARALAQRRVGEGGGLVDGEADRPVAGGAVVILQVDTSALDRKAHGHTSFI